MTELLRSWILGLTGAALFCAAATLLTPAGQVKSVVRMLCGVVMAAALLAPLLRPELRDYGLNLSKYWTGAEALAGDAEKIRQSMDRRLIEEKMEAYILDKAASLGASVQGAKVTLEWSTEGLWYPTAATLEGAYSAALSRALEAELGIPAAAQTWRGGHENP